MPTDPTVPEISYAIEYEMFAGREYNADFRGQGRLVIRPAGPTFVFTGKRRAYFSGAPIEREFSADDIWNVALNGREIRFRTRNSSSPKPFYFVCRDAQEAAEVATLLPPPDEEDATGTIWVRVPATAVELEPVIETLAVWPTLRLAMSDSAKLALATIGPIDSSMAYPLGALTLGSTLTAMINPSAGAVRVAALTAAWAALTVA